MSSRVITRRTWIFSPSRTIVQVMHWVMWVLVVWIALSVVAALIFGRVIATRDRREKPSPLEIDDHHGDAETG